nr:MAG TPA: hypothetical protein [Caudoviricetes sp.]
MNAIYYIIHIKGTQGNRIYGPLMVGFICLFRPF